MRIAVIGAGAMGSIYGGHLSVNNEVFLVDTNEAVVSQINEKGLTLEENGKDNLYHPRALTDTSKEAPMDLVILFVKALFSKAALSGNSSLIGPETYLMTLQNGSGHEDILQNFAPLNRIIIGTTNDNGAVLGPGHVRHGGEGETNIGMLVPDEKGFLPKLKETMDACGFKAEIRDNIQQLIWDKMFTNVSLSAVTALLSCTMGYPTRNEYAFAMVEQLVREAAAVARGMGLMAEEGTLLEKVRKTSEGSPNGITSICADIRAGRKTEVETISGSVVRAAEKCGVPAPTHRFVVNMIHALEDMPKNS